MKPQVLLQWTGTLLATSDDELRTIAESLMAEMDRGGYSIIPEKRLQTMFYPQIATSKEQISEIRRVYHLLLDDRFLPITELGDTETVVIVDAYEKQLVDTPIPPGPPAIVSEAKKVAKKRYSPKLNNRPTTIDKKRRKRR